VKIPIKKRGIFKLRKEDIKEGIKSVEERVIKHPNSRHYRF
jgi:hypothetical protein